jgi:hypothetical protein
MKRRTEGPKFEKESDLCAAFIAAVDVRDWACFAETEGWDILAVRKADGVQVGIEAKLHLNAHVVAQALPQSIKWTAAALGPDYRAVLVPSGETQLHLKPICDALGITIISYRGTESRISWCRAFDPALPEERMDPEYSWFQWAPDRRYKLPDYIPDVAAGASAPIALTQWKIRAIKLVIILKHRPAIREDFKLLGLSPSRWTDPYTGWLKRTDIGYVAGPNMPDFAAQHPRNFAEIEADSDTWMEKHRTSLHPLFAEQSKP